MALAAKAKPDVAPAIKNETEPAIDAVVPTDGASTSDIELEAAFDALNRPASSNLPEEVSVEPNVALGTESEDEPAAATEQPTGDAPAET